VRIGVIGGGTIGMVSAYYLSKNGHEVTVFEAKDSTGGLASSFRLGNGRFIERFYHYYSPGDTRFLNLVGELDLTCELEWRNVRQAMFIEKKLHSSTGLLDVLSLPGLSIFDKFRFLASMYFLLKKDEWEPLDRISCKDWITSNAGRNVYERLWKHLFETKFDRYADETPVSWLWSRSLRLAKSRKNVLGRETYGYFRDSSKVLFDRLETNIVSRNGKILLNTRVENIISGKGKTKIVAGSGREYEFDRVLATVPMPEIRRIAPDVFGQLSGKLRNREYDAVKMLVVELKERFSEYFILNICDTDVPFPAIIEFSNLKPKEEINNRNMIYIPNYMPLSSGLYSMNADELLSHYMPHLKKMKKGFDADQIADHYVFNDDFVEPYPFLGYCDHIPEFAEPVNGVYLANMSQVHPWINILEHGISYAERLAAWTCPAA